MAKLLTVSGVELPLECNCCYVIGRSAQCDIRVDDIASSRRHAQLIVGNSPNKLHIEDLGSRNGTFVNEVRIGERRRLRDGSEIRIGASVYRACLNAVETTLGDHGNLLDDTGTIGMERLSLGAEVGEEVLRVLRAEGPSLTDFAGKLEIFGLAEVLQLLINNRRSGTLHLALDTGHGRVEVREGSVLDASFQDATGFDALIRIAREERGMFWLVEKSTHCPNQIDVPQPMLLIEMCRYVDEANDAANTV